MASRSTDGVESAAMTRTLDPCSSTPNCVSSQDSRESHRVEPFAFEGAADAAFERLEEIIGELPRTRVVKKDEDYLRAECRSAIFRFVDDLELLVDADAGVIHVRSASRVGYSDLGVNRRRVEEIRSLFAGS